MEAKEGGWGGLTLRPCVSQPYTLFKMIDRFCKGLKRTGFIFIWRLYMVAREQFLHSWPLITNFFFQVLTVVSCKIAGLLAWNNNVEFVTNCIIISL